MRGFFKAKTAFGQKVILNFASFASQNSVDSECREEWVDSLSSSTFIIPVVQLATLSKLTWQAEKK